MIEDSWGILSIKFYSPVQIKIDKKNHNKWIEKHGVGTKTKVEGAVLCCPDSRQLLS